MKLLTKCIVMLKLLAKAAAVCTVITGAVTTFWNNYPSMTGFTLIAAGLTTYAAAKLLPLREYEKTSHISPRNSKN